METDTPDDILRATGRALCADGYADLTMQGIAEQSSTTTAAIHYHFDTKEELLSAFLDDLIARFRERLACEERDPQERLAALLDAVFVADDADEFPVALMELKAQAPYHDSYRERFRELDDEIRHVVAAAVRDGVDSDAFREADPERVAHVVAAMVNGAHARYVTLGESPTVTRREVEATLASRLGWNPEVVA